MKVIFNASKDEVYEYFKKGGQFESEMRKYREGINQRLYWSRIFKPTLIGFNVGFGKGKTVQMRLIEAETNNNKTVFNIKPSISFIVVGIVLLPLCFVGVIPIIAYFMRNRLMEKNFKEYEQSTISNRFEVIYT